MLQETTAAAPAAAGGNNAAALQQMGFDHLITQLDFVGWAVLITLTVMSLMSWYWIIINFVKNVRMRGRGNNVIGTFWETPNAQDAIRFMEEQPKSEPFSKIALDAAQAAAHHQRHEGSGLENGLTVLATVGSTAPFVGLLGTVWGIYRALIKIGASGDASISAVAGPVGEALIMTALGLGVAIPAVLAYNFFVRLNRVSNSQFDTFAHDLHDFFATGSRVGEVAGKR